MSKNIIFISEQLFKERTGASPQIDSRQIVPMVKVAQDMHIQPALGSTLYKRLQAGIEANNLTLLEKSLLDEYITDALVWYTMAMLPMTIGFQLFAKGFLQKGAEESTAPDRADLELLEQKYLSMGEFYKTRLIRYLQENEELFTEYLNFDTTIDAIQPELKGYTCPIFLGDSYVQPDDKPIISYGGGGGGCGDCPVSVDGVTITGDGTQANPLIAVGGSGGGAISIPTPIVTFRGGDSVYDLMVHFMDTGFDFSTAANPELFIFRHKAARHKKITLGSNYFKPSRWVHPTTAGNDTKWAGWKFFRGDQFIMNNGFIVPHDTRVTEFAVPATIKPYERLTIPFNKYMFFSTKNGGDHVDVDENVLNTGGPTPTATYKIHDATNQQNGSLNFRMTGTRRKKNFPHNFVKVNSYCLALAIDNPEATQSNGLCPKIFGGFSNVFHVIWDVRNQQGEPLNAKFSHTINNRLARVVRPSQF